MHIADAPIYLDTCQDAITQSPSRAVLRGHVRSCESRLSDDRDACDAKKTHYFLVRKKLFGKKKLFIFETSF